MKSKHTAALQNSNLIRVLWYFLLSTFVNVFKMDHSANTPICRFFLNPVGVPPETLVFKSNVTLAVNIQLHFHFEIVNGHSLKQPLPYPVFSVSVFLCMSAKPAPRWAMHAGSCTVWNMGSSQMDRCPLTRPLEEEMTPSTHFSVRQGLESMFPGPSLLTWNLQSLVSNL